MEIILHLTRVTVYLNRKQIIFQICKNVKQIIANCVEDLSFTIAAILTLQIIYA